MSSNPNFFRPPFRRLERKAMVAKSLSVLSLLVPAAVMAVDLPPTDQEGICRVYMLHDDRLNDSLFMYVDVPVLPTSDVLEAKPMKNFSTGQFPFPGLDLESMDVGPTPGIEPGIGINAIYVASSDDSVYVPGMLFRANLSGGITPTVSLNELGQVCVEMVYPYGSGNPLEERCLEEIDGISFGYAEPDPAPGTNPFCLWGVAQDAGLFKVCLTEDGEDLVPSTAELLQPFPTNYEFEDLTWNFAEVDESSTMLYAVVNIYPPPGGPNVDPGGFYDNTGAQELWRYDPVSGGGLKVCEDFMLCAQVEGMDAIPNDALGEPDGDLLMVTYHDTCKDGLMDIAQVKIDGGGNCSVTKVGGVGIDFSVLKTIEVDGHKMQKYADIEGMTWPCPIPEVCNGMLTYAKDRNDDSTEVPEPDKVEKKHSPVNVGGTNFELYGAAAKQSCDGEITLAVNTNGMMGLGGYESKNLNLAPNVAGSGAAGQRQYNVGDFMIQLLDGDNIDEASVIALYGAHFEINNDTGSTETGLYKLNGDGSSTGAMSTNSINYGWFNLFAYNLKVKGATGENHSLAHVPYNFFNMFGPAPTNIDMSIATKVADVTVLANRTEVYDATDDGAGAIKFSADIEDTQQGLTFNTEGGDGDNDKDLNTEEDNTIGVSFQRPDNDDWNNAKYMRVWIFTECNNDGVALETALIPLGD
jgi:hypothetical protein